MLFDLKWFDLAYRMTRPSFNTSQDFNAPQESCLSPLCAWVICPSVILFSNIPVFNVVARSITLAFIALVFLVLMFGKRKIVWPTPILTYNVWSFYVLLPSLLSVMPEYAIIRWVSVFLLALTCFSVVNISSWGESYKAWLWAYILSCLASYFVVFIPDRYFAVLDYETTVLGRAVGTFGNANAFGRAMVQSALLTMLLIYMEKKPLIRSMQWVLLLIFAAAVLQSGSRTALIGLVISVLGGLVVVGARAVVSFKSLLLISGGGVVAYTASLCLNKIQFTVFDRMEILFSFFGVGEKVHTSEHSLDHRMALMKDSIDLFLNSPFGIGLDNYRTVAGTYAHSNYFELLASVGVLGVMLYYFGFGRWLYLLNKRQAFYLHNGIRKYLILFVLVICLMDISSVCYYSKSLWLAIAILSGMMISFKSHQKNALKHR